MTDAGYKGDTKTGEESIVAKREQLLLEMKAWLADDGDVDMKDFVLVALRWARRATEICDVLYQEDK